MSTETERSIYIYIHIIIHAKSILNSARGAASGFPGAAGKSMGWLVYIYTFYKLGTDKTNQGLKESLFVPGGCTGDFDAILLNSGGCFYKLWVHFLGVLVLRPFCFGVYALGP